MSEEWCSYDSNSFADLELHMDVGLHDIQEKRNETFYDGIRRD